MSRIYTHCFHAVIWLGQDHDQDPQDAARKFVPAQTQHLACTILRKESFRRLWIIQEVLLPAATRVQRKTVWLQIETLVAALQGLAENRLPPLAFHNFMLLGAPARDQQLMLLETCLVRYAAQECQGPRDKVYGLLGFGGGGGTHPYRLREERPKRCFWM